MRTRLATILVTAALISGLSACDQINQASNAADKASVCLDAVRLAGFYPDLSNPEQAAKDAEKTANELAALAAKTSDTTLKDAISDMSSKIDELGPGTIDPSSVANWAKTKLNAVNALSQACL